MVGTVVVVATVPPRAPARLACLLGARENEHEHEAFPFSPALRVRSLRALVLSRAPGVGARPRAAARHGRGWMMTGGEVTRWTGGHGRECGSQSVRSVGLGAGQADKRPAHGDMGMAIEIGLAVAGTARPRLIGGRIGRPVRLDADSIPR